MKDTIRRHAIFHLPGELSNIADRFANMLAKEGFSIFGNDDFIAASAWSKRFLIQKSTDDALRADIVITIGDYSRNDRRFHCNGTARSVDIDVSSLGNEIQAMWLVMVMAGLMPPKDGEVHPSREIFNFAVVEPFLTALKNHKRAIAMKASEMATWDERLRETVTDVGEAYRSSLTHSPFIDRLVELASQKPDSIYAELVARLDTVPK